MVMSGVQGQQRELRVLCPQARRWRLDRTSYVVFQVWFRCSGVVQM